MVIHDLPESLKHSKAFDLRVLDTDDAAIYQTSSSQVSFIGERCARTNKANMVISAPSIVLWILF